MCGALSFYVLHMRPGRYIVFGMFNVVSSVACQISTHILCLSAVPYSLTQFYVCVSRVCVPFI